MIQDGDFFIPPKRKGDLSSMRSKTVWVSGTANFLLGGRTPDFTRSISFHGQDWLAK